MDSGAKPSCACIGIGDGVCTQTQQFGVIQLMAFLGCDAECGVEPVTAESPRRARQLVRASARWADAVDGLDCLRSIPASRACAETRLIERDMRHDLSHCLEVPRLWVSGAQSQSR